MREILKYKKLGSTELAISEIGLGTAQIGGPSIINGKPVGAKPISDKEANSILSYARDAGVNFFDSSDKYGDGLAETRLGKFFKRVDEVIFATKCGIDENGKRRFDQQYITKVLEGSLRRLNRERIDLFQITKPTLSNISKDDLAETMMRFKAEGKIRYAGISVGDISDAEGYLHQDIWDSFQVIYNLLTLDFKNFISNANSINKGVIARSPLSSGMLCGCFDENTKFEDSDDRSKFMYGTLLKTRFQLVEALKKRFDISNEELAVFSLNFLISDPEVTTIIPGSTSILQAKTNLKVLELPRFTSEQWNEINSFMKKANEQYIHDSGSFDKT